MYCSRNIEQKAFYKMIAEGHLFQLQQSVFTLEGHPRTTYNRNSSTSLLQDDSTYSGLSISKDIETDVNILSSRGTEWRFGLQVLVGLNFFVKFYLKFNKREKLDGKTSCL